ncbi:hypothetical protein AB6A40_005424 [Gnathostoma spinigerum]|uniref:NR LBD domain-containing protein n=1 Tax=Gnathostoma spinigerum TaxID=75299 RepID=A0ABD6EGJ3_9BILA
MSRDAVKFGRMSKKQREKVEDEVRMHKQMAEVNGISYSPYGEYSPPNQTVYANGYDAVYATTYANTAAYAAAAPVSYTSVPGQGYAIAQQAAVPAPNGGYPRPNIGASQSDEDLIRSITTAFDSAHSASLRARERGLAQPLDSYGEHRYRIMSRLDAWKKFAHELTRVIQSIIEFAKMVDGFMQLGQEEQIALLKGGVFELATIVLSQQYDPETTSIAVDREILPASLFQSNDQAEMQFIIAMHSCIHEFAQLQLTPTETALLSTWILLDRSSSGQYIVEQLRHCLQQELSSRVGDCTALMQRLCDLMIRLRSLAQEHMRLLSQLGMIYPQANERGTLPDLYKELFTPSA